MLKELRTCDGHLNIRIDRDELARMKSAAASETPDVSFSEWVRQALLIACSHVECFRGAAAKKRKGR